MTTSSDLKDDTQRADTPSPSLVVGIGASAGGLDPCKRLLESAPVDKGIAFVVVLHLAPAHESHVAEILKTTTSMEVTQVTDQQTHIQPNHVYVIAPATSLSIRGGGTLEVAEPDHPHYRAKPINDFFSSLAADQRENAVGIVLSGTGDDGAAGLEEIQSAGGLCIVQDPKTAEYDGMPQSAIDTGAADAVVSPEAMGRLLIEYAAVPHVRPAPRPSSQQKTEGPGDELDAILALLSKQYRVNFREYKKNTLERRTKRRMGLKQISAWQDYLVYLHAHPEEVEALYGDILIGVTKFFRDPEEWEFLEQKILPALLDSHDADTPVRAWSAGCATGEEAYSLAMIILEHMERAGRHCKLQVFASDVSHEALAFARRGLYPAGIEGDVSPQRLRRFFHRVGEHFQVDRELRDRVTFAAHNLLSDPPFTALDLVSCRNVLIYLEPHAQERLLDLFHFSLRPQGVLWLGSSETINRRSAHFSEIPGKPRFYLSVGRARLDRYHVPRWVAERVPIPGLPPAPMGPPQGPKVARRLEQWVLERYTAACVIIDQKFNILYSFGPTGEYLTQPIGETRMDLLSWVRPGLFAKLRTGLSDAAEHKRTVSVMGRRVERDTAAARVEVTIDPVTSVPEADGLFVVAFRDLPNSPQPAVTPDDGGELKESLLRQVEQELRETRQELQSTVDQLETANEEHYASHEELLSLNEELQSSNEELESSKEELQSLNEELTIINRQLEERNTELRSLTSDLNNLLVSTNIPTLFLDLQHRIRRFTPACTKVMYIVSTDIGRSIENVKILVRDDNLLADTECVLKNLAVIEAEVSSYDGRWFLRKVQPYRADTERVDGVCITFHDITVQKRAAAEIEDARLLAEAVISTSRTPLLVLDSESHVVSANEAFYEVFQTSETDTVGRRLYELGNGQWDIPKLRDLLDVLPTQRTVRNYDVEHVFDSIGWRTMRLNADVMARTSQPNLLLLSIEDITDLRKAELAAKRRADELGQNHRRKDEFLAMLGHELRNPLAALANGLAVMKKIGGDAEAIERVRAMMTRQTQRMIAMLDQLLDAARVSSGKFELAQDAVDMVEAAKAAIETVQPLLESAQHELTVSFPPQETALVLGDGVRLAQVLENLLGNAAKYTETGGHIWLTITTMDDTIKLSVRDTGIGLDPDMLDHAFELFTQSPRSLHRAQGGLGLGLPLVRSLVELHGGHVDVFSAGLGQGSEFVVTLPRLRLGHVARPRDEDATLPATSGRRVLIVDDEDDVVQSLVDILTMQGHEVRAAHDGATALDAARAFKPEVVLLDLGLPKMNGYEVARKLRAEHGKGMLLIALTGYQKDAPHLHETGFDEHLLKPPDLEKLLALLDGCHERT